MIYSEIFKKAVQLGEPVVKWLWEHRGALGPLFELLESTFKRVFGPDPRGKELKHLVELWLIGAINDEQFISQATSVLSNQPPIPLEKRAALLKEMNKLRTKELLSMEKYQLLSGLLFPTS